MNLHTPIKSWKRPPEFIPRSICLLILWFFPVTGTGLENIPPNARKVIFVANHQRYGVEAIALAAFIYMEKGIIVRALVDKMFASIPLVKHLLYYFGSVVGTRENCAAVMECHDPMLVFPGGSHEVFRAPELPNYTVMWRDRTGFVRMAAEHGYTIIPLSNIGLEDMMPVWMSLPMTYFYWVIGDSRANARVRSEVFEDGTPKDAQERLPIPNPLEISFQTFYVSVGAPVVTSDVDATNKEDLERVQRKAKKVLEDGIRTCQQMQASDPNRYTSTIHKLRRHLSSTKEKSS
jgi:1-acyl-sn-glycerol-3-phosphate acyltransferase